MARLAFAVAAALIFIAIEFGTRAYAQEANLSVEGQVVNVTSGALSPAGLTVTFHREGANLHEHLTTVTDSQGRFRFDGLDYDPTLVYGVSLRYQDALYGRDVNFSQGSPEPFVLNIFDAVSNQEVITTNSASVLFANSDRETQTIAALEIVQISNNSDKTFVPGTDNPMNLIRFGLPPDSAGLEVDTRLLGADIVQVDRGFAVLGSIPPGSHEIMFTYVFPYSDTETTFDKSFPFGVENLRVLSPYEVLTISSNDIGDTAPVDIGERRYQLIEAADIPRGARISVNLTDLPQQTFRDKVTQSIDAVKFEYTAPVLLIIVLGSLMLIAIRKRRLRQMTPVATPYETSVAEQERLTIRKLIADTESSFRAGTLAEDEYYRRRRILESRLNSLWSSS